jgi:hypothetical protein
MNGEISNTLLDGKICPRSEPQVEFFSVIGKLILLICFLVWFGVFDSFSYKKYSNLDIHLWMDPVFELVPLYPLDPRLFENYADVK